MNLLEFPDEILKHITIYLDFWDKNALRAVCRRFYVILVHDVRKIVITKEWVLKLQKSRRVLKSTKYSAAERREKKEKIVILYITRHRNLRVLHFHQSGLSLIHRASDWRKYFVHRLARNCPDIEELLVQGTSGLTIAVDYVTRTSEHPKRECRLKTLYVDPYQAGSRLCSQLLKLARACPSLSKVTFISEMNDTDLSRDLCSAKKMLSQLNGQVEYFSTDFSGDYCFKLLAIEELQDIHGLTLCRAKEGVNNFPLSPHHIEKIVANNPNLNRLRIAVSNESLIHLNTFSNITHLSVVLSCHLSRSLFSSIFASIGSNLSLLSFTFAGSPKSLMQFDVNFNFSLIRNLNIFSLQGQHELHLSELLDQLGANCRLLTEFYYSGPEQAIEMASVVETVRTLCPNLQLVVIQKTQYKSDNAFSPQINAEGSFEKLEKRFFY